MSENRKITGNLGEEKASGYLIENEYEILQRNYREKSGEIDIIAYKGETVVFVEVKTLPNGSLEMLKKELGEGKQKRIIKTAKRFLLNHRQYNNSYVRFDVIVIDMPLFGPVYHIENAFSELL